MSNDNKYECMAYIIIMQLNQLCIRVMNACMPGLFPACMTKLNNFLWLHDAVIMIVNSLCRLVSSPSCIPSSSLAGCTIHPACCMADWDKPVHDTPDPACND